MRLTGNVKIPDAAQNAGIKKESEEMIKILKWLILILCVIEIILLIGLRIKTTKLLKELKELNSTLEYIDKRMDTLEFYRVPEQYKK